MLTELKYLRKDGERQSAAKSPGRRQPLASGLPCGPMCLRACESPRAAQRFKMILALVALDARIHPRALESPSGQSLISPLSLTGSDRATHRRPVDTGDLAWGWQYQDILSNFTAEQYGLKAPGDLRAAHFESLFQSLSNSETLRRGVGESNRISARRSGLFRIYQA